LGKKAAMSNEPEANEFAVRQADDQQYRSGGESVRATQTRTFDHDAALVPSRRANRIPTPTPTPTYVVLAVADDERARLDTVMMLEDLGHTVFKATSGEQALERLRREPAIDLVVADMAMQLMSGLELCVAAQRVYPSLRFMLTTGSGESPDSDEPALLRLPRPFLQFDLARTVELAMEMAPWSPRVIWL
jgi:CheY-like chemotaxis protein